jgi:hypothetical protein
MKPAMSFAYHVSVAGVGPRENDVPACEHDALEHQFGIF